MNKDEAPNQTQHSTNYWLHEIEMANIRGYKQGRESGLKEALTQPEQEPVGHLYSIAGVQHCTIERLLSDGPLYTSPPKREWVGLTAVEWQAMYDQFAKYQNEGALTSGWGEFAHAIEVLLKEKNT